MGEHDLEKANKAFQSEDYDRAFALFDALSQQGDNRVNICLGWLYMQGFGTPQDFTKAKDLFKNLEEQEEAQGSYYLGSLLLKEGKLEEAKLAFEKAAQLANPSAAYWAYELNSGYAGSKIDLQKASHFLSLAENLGHIYAKRELSKQALRNAHGVIDWLRAVGNYMAVFFSGLWRITRDHNDPHTR